MLDASCPALPATTFVQPLTHRAIVSLSAFRGKTPQFQQVLGVELPATPRRVMHEGTTYLWSGPESWLAISDNPTLLENLGTAARNLAAVTDQSDGRSLFRVTGPYICSILAKLVPIDLHPSSFLRDATALTLADHIGIQLWQEDDGAFVLACFRSYGGALHHALVEAAQEFEAARHAR
jgi:heterotetrameric sarcosine oxidase gamma subunit